MKSIIANVTGYNFPSVIYGADNFANVVKQHLTDQGVSINNVLVGQLTNQFTGFYQLIINVNALDEDTNARIQQLLFQVLSQDLNTLTIEIITPESIPTYNQQYPNTGTGNSLIPSATALLGVSTTTLLLVGVGLALFIGFSGNKR